MNGHFDKWIEEVKSRIGEGVFLGVDNDPDSKAMFGRGYSGTLKEVFDSGICKIEHTAVSLPGKPIKKQIFTCFVTNIVFMEECEIDIA